MANVKSLISYERHRNGIMGKPFYVCIFERQREAQSDFSSPAPEENIKMMAILFDEPMSCAVLGMEKLINDDIEFGSNSWRGDHFDGELRQLIKEVNLKRKNEDLV